MANTMASYATNSQRASSHAKTCCCPACAGLECLDERDKMMLILKEVEGFAVEEIAEILDLNANTVKVRLFRARRRIVTEARKRTG